MIFFYIKIIFCPQKQGRKEPKMAQLNKVIIAGRLTADPEVKVTKNNLKVCNFSIANSEGKEITNFFYCSAFRNNAEYLEKYAKKGTLLVIDGYLHQDKWTTPNGEKRNSVSIVCQNVHIMDRVNTPKETTSETTSEKSSNNEVSSEETNNKQNEADVAEQLQQQGFVPADDIDEDLPF